jgi:hypothetical protein
LDSARDRRPCQLLVALGLLLREHQRRPRLVDLRLAGADLCLLHDDPCIKGFDACLRRHHLRLGFGKRVPIVALVDASDYQAGNDVLVVGNRYHREVTGHLGSDRKVACRDEGISVVSKWLA